MPYYTLMPMFGASLIIDRSWTQILALYNLLQILGLLCWISLIREVTIDDFVGQLHWFPHAAHERRRIQSAGHRNIAVNSKG